MTYVSCSSLFLWEYSLEEITALLRRAGIDSIEFWPETPAFWLERNEELRRTALVEALAPMQSVSVHTPILDLNPSSYNDRVVEATFEEGLWAMELAADIGANPLTIHPGKRTVGRRPTQRDRRLFDEYLDAVAQAAGENGVVVGVENLAPMRHNLCSTPGEIREVLDSYPVGFTFDVGHALLADLETALQYVELADRMVNVHLDVERDGVHSPPSLDRESISEVLRALMNAGYDGQITLEIDDQAYPGGLSHEEKIEVLSREQALITEILDDFWK